MRHLLLLVAMVALCGCRGFFAPTYSVCSHNNLRDIICDPVGTAADAESYMQVRRKEYPTMHWWIVIGEKRTWLKLPDEYKITRAELDGRAK